jgi:hypothetical protein
LDEVESHGTTSNIYVLHKWWGWMDVTQEGKVEVKQKLLEAAKISKLPVPTQKLFENRGEQSSWANILQYHVVYKSYYS